MACHRWAPALGSTAIGIYFHRAPNIELRFATSPVGCHSHPRPPFDRRTSRLSPASTEGHAAAAAFRLNDLIALTFRDRVLRGLEGFPFRYLRFQKLQTLHLQSLYF